MLQGVMQIFMFNARNIYDLNRTGVSTVHRPACILASNREKQVGNVSSDERQLHITIISAVNELQN